MVVAYQSAHTYTQTHTKENMAVAEEMTLSQDDQPDNRYQERWVSLSPLSWLSYAMTLVWNVWRDAMCRSWMNSTAMPDLWSSNSHDLNPVNYVWGIIQLRVHQTKVQDVNDLRKSLTDVSPGVEHSVIDDVIA